MNKNLLLIFGIGIILLNPIIQLDIAVIRFESSYIWLIFSCIIQTLILIALFIKYGCSLSLVSGDIAVSLFFTVPIMTIYLDGEAWQKNSVTLMSYLILYYYCRVAFSLISMRFYRYIYLSFVFALSFQVLLFMSANLLNSREGATIDTGNFLNTGPMSIYLCTISCFLAPILCYPVKGVIKTCLYLLIAIAIIIVCYSYSRASITGLIIVAFYLVKIANPGLAFVRLKGYKRYLALGIIVFFFLAIYVTKKDSADGRVLVWQVAKGCILKDPVLGIGYGKFKEQYNYQQGLYFLNEPVINMNLKKLAGDIRFAFNDYLEIVIERGIVGLLLFCAILLMIFKTEKRVFDDPLQFCAFQGAKCGLLFLAVVSFFSYPASVIPIQNIFTILLAIVFSHQPAIVSFQIKKRFVTLLSLLLFIFSIKLLCVISIRYSSMKKWNNIFINPVLESYAIYTDLLNKIKDEPILNLQFGQYLEENNHLDKALEQYLLAVNRLPVKDGFYLLGNLYEKKKRYTDAERTYKTVKYMFPNLLKPEYLLAKLYFKEHNFKMFIQSADRVNAFFPKVPSMEIYKMKEEIRQIRSDILYE